ncbi:ATP-dependent Clp protease proteolytic subunit [Chlamydia psittaci]|uniref:ATP-dependent Clp protease proteolytic subunit n=2 Tax=Chlamydia psittaci TaxID=83554 RepID=A0ABN0MPS0_CHLPS|nr:ATP-dependent Clp protease proteolytic subunit [Chlamydia psittaci]AFS19231.1 clp protease family protein [Chlamydia psittaci 84/55]AFS22429.1 clp protease family protein [Chlamydia psittaci VS225]AGE74811.1 ATP-dependent Clp protease proteolytic subunit [Chlamydia psittaci Mat116]EPJ16057.1 ATP-dependent Clp protease proteolytic subunit 1 [Chlamydia psittaci 02DC18]EPJ17191.1 ATP-dependent Clp protease proteolytic subunit 1 [Chlamydia psittaci 02DC22]EPJ19914.1 ATP-dependent Clp protease 
MPDGEVENKLRDVIERKILDARRVFFSEPVTDKSAAEAIKKLWYLELTNPGQPIVFVINSPGGSVDAGFAVWDQIKMMTSPVTTVVTGLAASMGSVLSLCAAPGRRFATPHSRIMIHQPSIGGPITGQATDLDIHAREILKTKKRIVDVYLEATGQSREVIEKAIDRDTWMTADEAKDFGLLDGILFSFNDL